MKRRLVTAPWAKAAFLLAATWGCAPEEDRNAAAPPGQGDAIGAATGSGGPMAVIDVGGYPRSIVARDFNADGRLDVAVLACDLADAWSDCRLLSVLGKGNGQFQAPVLAPLGYLRTYSDLQAGDFDGDGILDLVAIAGPGDLADAWWRGAGDGTFHPPIETPIETPPECGVSAPSCWPIRPLVDDFVGGSAFELLRRFDAFYSQHASSILENQGQGFVAPGLSIGSHAIASGDFDEDGRADLLTFAGVRLSNGDGTFQDAVASGLLYLRGNEVAVDLNGDGHLDLVQTYLQSIEYWDDLRMVGVSLGNGDGTFAPFLLRDSTLHFSVVSAVKMADVDVDGHEDLLLLSSQGDGPALDILLGDGTGHLPEHRAVDLDPVAVEVGDANGDQATDVLVGVGFRVFVFSGPQLPIASP